MVQLPVEKKGGIFQCWYGRQCLLAGWRGKGRGVFFSVPQPRTQPTGFSSALHHAITTCYSRLVTSDRLMYSRTPSLFVLSPSSFGSESHPTIKYWLRHCILVCFSKSFIFELLHCHIRIACLQIVWIMNMRLMFLGLCSRKMRAM